MTARRLVALVLVVAAGAALVAAAVFVARRDRPAAVIWTVPAIDTHGMLPRVVARLQDARSELRRNTSSGEAWGRMGAVCHAHGLHEEAAICYRRAWALAPGDFRWPYLLALVLELKAAPWQEISALLVAAAELQPGYAPAFVRLGDLRLEYGRPRGAAEAFDRALALDPQLAQAHRGLGQVALRTDQTSQAVDHLERATRLAPDDRAAWAALAQARRRAGDRGGAAAAADRSRALEHSRAVRDPVYAAVRALGISPKHCVERAVGLMNAGHYARAAEELEIVVEAEPNDARIHLYLGMSYAAIGRTRDAVESFRGAVQLAPQDAAAHYNLATALMMDEKPDEAVTHFREAVHLDSDYADAHYNLALALEKLGRAAEAIEHYGRAVQIDPNHPAAEALTELRGERGR